MFRLILSEFAKQVPLILLLGGKGLLFIFCRALHEESFFLFLQAFFQVNTKATEVLYQTVGQLAELDMDTTLVDVCCGLGTIGLCLAKEVKQVASLLHEILLVLSENSSRITVRFLEIV